MTNIISNFNILLNRQKGEWLQVKDNKLVKVESKFRFVLKNILSFGGETDKLREAISETLRKVKIEQSLATWEKLSRLSKKLCNERQLIPFLPEGTIVHLANTTSLQRLALANTKESLQRIKLSGAARHAIHDSFEGIKAEIVRGSTITAEKVAFIKPFLEALKKNEFLKPYIKEINEMVEFPELAEARVSYKAGNALTQITKYEGSRQLPDNRRIDEVYVAPSVFSVRDRMGREIGVWKPENEKGASRSDREVSCALLSTRVPKTAKITFAFKAHLTDDMQNYISAQQAYYLQNYYSHFSHPHFSAPPFPYMAYEKKYTRPGSFQKFVKGKEFLNLKEAEKGKIPTKQIHRLGIDDLRFRSTDRHGHNLLLDEDFNVWGIDNEASWGLAPFKSPDLCWKDLPQAKEPFDAETLAYIESLDAAKDRKVLEEHGITFSDEIHKEHEALIIKIKQAAKEGKSLFQIQNEIRTR